MYKSIKVDEATHRALKEGAFNRDITIKEHISEIAKNLVNGIIFDVEAHDTEWLEAVRDDIEIELEKRKNNYLVDKESKKTDDKIIDYRKRG